MFSHALVSVSEPINFLENCHEIRAPQPILAVRARSAEIFPGVTARALWAEQHGFTWFSVMDHMIEIPLYGAPDEPS